MSETVYSGDCYEHSSVLEYFAGEWVMDKKYATVFFLRSPNLCFAFALYSPRIKEIYVLCLARPLMP